MAREIVTRVKNAILYSDGTIRLDNVRASYPHLTTPFMDDKDKAKKGIKDRNSYSNKDDYISALIAAGAKYGIVGMLDKSTHVEAKDLCVKVINEIIAKADEKVAKDRKFIQNGDDTAKTEYEGYWTVSSREARKPTVRNRRGEVVSSDREIENMIYAGCRVNMLIRPWFQNNEFGKRVNAGIVAVQFAADDKQIGESRIDDEGAFDAIEDEDDGMGESSSRKDSLNDDDDL